SSRSSLLTVSWICFCCCSKLCCPSVLPNCIKISCSLSLKQDSAISRSTCFFQRLNKSGFFSSIPVPGAWKKDLIGCGICFAIVIIASFSGYWLYNISASYICHAFLSCLICFGLLCSF